jgi:N-methylhydantoinase A
MPFGGGGGLHVCAMMREVGVSTGIVPRYPGVTSALGCVIADLRHDAVQTLNTALDSLDVADLRARRDRLLAEARARLASAGVRLLGERELIALDMLYQGQTHTVSVTLGEADLNHAGIADAFERSYRAEFARTLPGIPVRVLNLRHALIGVRPKFDLSLLAPTAAAPAASVGHQPVHVQGQTLQAQRYARLDLCKGQQVLGPAILEQADTTVWLEPGFVATVDAFGNLILEDRQVQKEPA